VSYIKLKDFDKTIKSLEEFIKHNSGRVGDSYLAVLAKVKKLQDEQANNTIRPTRGTDKS